MSRACSGQWQPVLRRLNLILRRVWQDGVLLPLALLVVVVEDVLWRGARAVLRRLARLPPVLALQAWLGSLPPAAALPLFLVPEIAGRAGEIWAAWLLYRRHVMAAALVFAAMRLLAVLIAVFIWQACAPALLRLRWFARLVGWVHVAREWALDRIAPFRARVLLLLRRRGGDMMRRVAELRRRLAVRTRR